MIQLRQLLLELIEVVLMRIPTAPIEAGNAHTGFNQSPSGTETATVFAVLLHKLGVFLLQIESVGHFAGSYYAHRTLRVGIEGFHLTGMIEIATQRIERSQQIRAVRETIFRHAADEPQIAALRLI